MRSVRSLALGAAVLVSLTALSGCAPEPAPSTSPMTTAPATAPVTAEATATAEPTAPAPTSVDPAALVWPAQGQGAVGLAAPDGTVQVLGQSPNAATTPVPIASITKVVTALVVLDAHPLVDADDPGPTITLGQADLDITAAVEAEQQFTEPMYEGQQVTLRDALAITLLTSANNYAESAARWAYGSQEGFLAAARGWLDEHGLTSTTLADASGLNPGSASTPAELLRVAALAHADPALAAVAGTASLEQADLGTIVNQNTLLGENGVDGLKTGSTSYAGFTLLTSAQRTVGTTTVTLVSVVLGTPSLDARFADTRALLASAEAALAP
ncbi:D-alanyl-D-alanine carboxypeptidase family protein [Herbiconiux sp. VKM Ac-2851]|uniref:D-alanyl-D-alanine carboxypeptidase family protein n=1 Tax=Herbiconiux sp. VKM Ac-2851 TaxID=2739025 RepID=UPI0015641BFB|nr:D-alanyl-D-alanine carboxypeptidase [Herbiconiux sp. VKM Ac-2851]NQX34462.1 D-alanyl-D-alanine carboxypeptidase [Herbiconiux sp. VKM Ac-2851]